MMIHGVYFLSSFKKNIHKISQVHCIIICHFVFITVYPNDFFCIAVFCVKGQE